MACATNLHNFNLALFRLVPSGDWYLWYNLSRDLLFLLLLEYNIEWTHLLGTTRLRAEALGALKTWTERLRFRGDCHGVILFGHLDGIWGLVKALCGDLTFSILIRVFPGSNAEWIDESPHLVSRQTLTARSVNVAMRKGLEHIL